MKEVVLKKPFEKDGKTYTKIVLDLEKMTGATLIEIEKEARLRGEMSPNPLFSQEGLAIAAAKASGFIPEDILNLYAPDFLEVTATVNNFLYGWVLPAEVPSETSGKSA